MADVVQHGGCDILKCHHAPPLIRLLPAQHLVHHDTKRVDVQGARQLLAPAQEGLRRLQAVAGR